MKKILIDTDVILDLFYDRKPFVEDAAKLFSLCEKGELKAYVSPVIISNLYYLLRRKAKHEKVIDKILELLKIIDVLPMDKQVVEKALHSKFNDFEDALQNFAAVQHGEIEAIITRNVKDYRKSEIGVFTPATFLKILKS